MPSETALRRRTLAPFELLRRGQDVIRREAEALQSLADRLPVGFVEAIDLLDACAGCVVVVGIGKAGLIGQKISATLASTGVRSFFLHPAEAVHGDLGRVHKSDVCLALSYSGETDELLRLLPALKKQGTPVVAMTARASSSLGQAATVALPIGSVREACSMGLAPSTSTTVMLALGDALALVLAERRGIVPEDFARWHPGGALGKKLSQVEDHMRPIEQCRVAPSATALREVFAGLARPGRRTGAIMLTDEDGVLVGLFTDSDLARLLETRRDAAFDGPIARVMTRSPSVVRVGRPLSEAVALLRERKISELPVVDDFGRPVGLLDVTDLLELLPDETPSS